MFRYLPFVVIAGGILLAVVGSMFLMGCVATQMSERPFSPEWNNLQKVNAELERRQAHINRVDQIVLFGSPKEGGAYVGKDKDGEPEFKIGKENGWELDLDYDNGPEAGIKYELNWDAARPGKASIRQE